MFACVHDWIPRLCLYSLPNDFLPPEPKAQLQPQAFHFSHFGLQEMAWGLVYMQAALMAWLAPSFAFGWVDRPNCHSAPKIGWHFEAEKRAFWGLCLVLVEPNPGNPSASSCTCPYPSTLDLDLGGDRESTCAACQPASTIDRSEHRSVAFLSTNVVSQPLVSRRL